MKYIKVYQQDRTMLGVLDNANAVGYSLKNNDLSAASLQLPSSDPKNALMAAHNLVQMVDGEKDIGLFRVLAIPDSRDSIADGWTQYQLEHVIATLVDDVFFGYHEIGGMGVYTDQVIKYILDRQTTRRWQLGRCDFLDQFTYKFENCNLLAALFSLGNVITDEYQWTYDMTTTPWTVNLVRLDTKAECEIRYRRNMREIQKTMDAGTLVTRLYMLGYGEGVNQLTISSKRRSHRITFGTILSRFSTRKALIR